MSTNPATKAYQKRVARIGSRLRYAGRHADLAEIMHRTDPSATQDMFDAAVIWAILDARSMAARYRKYATEADEEELRLEGYRDRLVERFLFVGGPEDEGRLKRATAGLRVYGGRQARARR